MSQSGSGDSRAPWKRRVAARPSRGRRERGAALLITALVLLLVSLLSFTSIRNSEQESSSSARSRATARTLHAGDAGLQLALAHLKQTPPDLAAFDIDLPENANVQSRTRVETAPQMLTHEGLGERPEGFGINADAGVIAISHVYRVNVTSTAGGSMTELEAKLSRLGTDSAGY